MALAGIVVKILGALYKIPLRAENFLGEAGAGFQGFAYPNIYFCQCHFDDGFHIAIAKLISENDANGNFIESESF